MLKLQKRPFDYCSPPATPVPCTPHRIQFLDSPSTKRSRHIDTMPDNEHSGSEETSASPDVAMRPAAPPLRPDTPFVASKRQVSAEDVEALRPKRKKLVMPGSPVPPAQEKIFSMEEVRSIVQKALDEHEKYIRAEYDRVLQERLNDQYANFAKFNQDAISRQLQQSEWSYMS